MLRKIMTAMLVLVAMSVTAGTAYAVDVAVHGTVSQGYLKSSEYNYLTPNTKDGTFAFNEAIVNLSTRVDDKTRIGIQLLGRDFGPEGNGNIILDWAFGDHRWRDYLGFRIGKVKTPLGLYNKTRDVDAVRTAVLMPQSVYNEGFRMVTTAFQGGSLYGNLPVSDNTSFDYELFGGTIEMDGTQFLSDTMSGAAPGAPMLSYDVETKYMAGGQLIWNTPLEGLRLGGTYLTLETNSQGSFANGTMAPTVIDMQLKLNSYYTLSAEYLWNDLSLAAEYTRMDTDILMSGVPYPDGAGGFMLIDIDQEDKRGGYYGQAAYRFSSLFELGTYYSVFHPNWDNKDGEDLAVDHRAYQKDLALTARFDVTDNWILKLEGHLIKGTGQLEPSYNPEGFDEENWNMFAAKSTFYF